MPNVVLNKLSCIHTRNLIYQHCKSGEKIFFFFKCERDFIASSVDVKLQLHKFILNFIRQVAYGGKITWKTLSE